MERLPFYIKNQIHYVDVIRTNNKNLYLRIKDQKIVVSVPKRTSLKVVSLFVDEHIHKFVHHLEKMQNLKTFNFDQKYVYIFKQKYAIKILTGFKKLSGKIIGSTLYLHVKLGHIDELTLVLHKFLTQTLLNYLTLKLPYYEKFMNLKPHTFKVVSKDSNWASNAIGKQKLSFALKLIHHHQQTIDYVIVHELAHDFEPNHSQMFWKIVNDFFPNYVIENDKLKNLD